MLEVCQRKCMFLSLGLLVTVTVIVLVLESHYAISGPGRRLKKQYVIENNSTCWQREEFSIVWECHPCTDFDRVSRKSGVCILSKYKEILRCSSGEIVIRSCDRVAEIDQSNFWKFQAFAFVLAVMGYTVAHGREQVLAHRNQQKLQRLLNHVP